MKKIKICEIYFDENEGETEVKFCINTINNFKKSIVFPTNLLDFQADILNNVPNKIILGMIEENFGTTHEIIQNYKKEMKGG